MGLFQVQELSEHQLQTLILEYLERRQIWAKRMNRGAMGGSYRSKKTGKTSSYYVKFGFPGMGDILLAPKINGVPVIGWIEVKSRKGKQLLEQQQFQADCDYRGMLYIVARSLDDVINGLEDYRNKLNNGQIQTKRTTEETMQYARVQQAVLRQGQALSDLQGRKIRRTFKQTLSKR